MRLIGPAEQEVAGALNALVGRVSTSAWERNPTRIQAPAMWVEFLVVLCSGISKHPLQDKGQVIAPCTPPLRKRLRA